MTLLLSLIVIAMATYALLREADVRLVLFAAGIALATVGGEPLAIFDTFLAEMGNGKTIGPICSGLSGGHGRALPQPPSGDFSPPPYSLFATAAAAGRDIDGRRTWEDP